MRIWEPRAHKTKNWQIDTYDYLKQNWHLLTPCRHELQNKKQPNKHTECQWRKKFHPMSKHFLYRQKIEKQSNNHHILQRKQYILTINPKSELRIQSITQSHQSHQQLAYKINLLKNYFQYMITHTHSYSARLGLSVGLVKIWLVGLGLCLIFGR